MANSGCVTTLGYIPEHPKPIADTATLTPTYGEVKKWAYDVLDGYDSRATLNRHAIYGGALIAAAAVGAIAGLAAFDSGSSALIGIPIGTGFLGSVAAIYSSEEKAQIYRFASEYVKDLISDSEKRNIKRNAASQNPDAAIADATRLRDKALNHHTELIAQETTHRNNAKKARDDANSAAPNTPDRAAKEKIADAAEKLAIQAASDVATAKVELEEAETRLRNLTRLKQALEIVKTVRQELEKAKKTPDDKAEVQRAERALAAAEKTIDPDTSEALCLRDDVNDVMRRVEEHKALLDPKNIAARLQSIRAPRTSTQGTTPAAGGATATQVSPGDLSDLQTPVKSRCDNAI
jgi:hypothetical protein